MTNLKYLLKRGAPLLVLAAVFGFVFAPATAQFTSPRTYFPTFTPFVASGTYTNLPISTFISYLCVGGGGQGGYGGSYAKASGGSGGAGTTAGGAGSAGDPATVYVIESL